MSPGEVLVLPDTVAFWSQVGSLRAGFSGMCVPGVKTTAVPLALVHALSQDW